MTKTEHDQVVRATVGAITRLLWIVALGVWLVVAAIHICFSGR